MIRLYRCSVLLGCLFLTAALVAAQAPAQPQSSTQALDQQITTFLRDKFAKNKDLSNVHVSVEDRIVRLTGSVSNLRAKLQADQDARQVSSVDGVSNRITVDTEKVPDQQLEREIADRLVYDRIGMGQTFNSLNLKVRDGIVTVSGTVIDYPSRDSAVDIIVATPGVKGVVDDINVAPVSPNDDRIRMAVARAIYGSPQFLSYANNPAHPIRIVVTNGRVTLTGVVNSSADKNLAGMKARSVPGVFGVTNDLVVSSGS